MLQQYRTRHSLKSYVLNLSVLAFREQFVEIVDLWSHQSVIMWLPWQRQISHAHTADLSKFPQGVKEQRLKVSVS